MNLIVAVDKNWAIGLHNKLLVSIPADMKFFRETTMGKVVVMGRKTLESFPGGQPLKKRTNIVLTSDKNYKVKDAVVVNSVEALLEELREINPYLEVETDCVRVTDENVGTLFHDEDIICEAFDRPEAKAMLVSGVGEYYPDKILVAGSGMAGYGRSNEIVTRKINEHFYLCGDAHTEPVKGRGLMAPRVAICAAHQANLITELIIRGK